MIERIRLFLAIEILVFASAALVHSGWLIGGYEDAGAGIAESVIAIVLLAGLVVSWIRPASTRDAGIAVQAFGLLGTCVGTALLIFVGPRTVLDVVYHVVMLALLVWGLAVALRSPASQLP